MGMNIYYFFMDFFIYGFLGWCMEVIFAAVKQKKFVNRGFLNGPICPIYGIGVGLVVQLLSDLQSNILLLYVVSVILVTTLEWITGYILEKVFHNKWWDYSHMPMNINGYVCLPFSLIWGVACVLIVHFVHPLFHRLIMTVNPVVGLVILIILGLALFVDLYVTASGIFKLNRRLASMERIASELHEIADNIGAGLYKGVVEAMEKQAEVKEKLDISEDVKERIAELRQNYHDLAVKRGFLSKRLTQAFPRMKPKKYKEAWEELRQRLKFK